MAEDIRHYEQDGLHDDVKDDVGDEDPEYSEISKSAEVCAEDGNTKSNVGNYRDVQRSQ